MASRVDPSMDVAYSLRRRKASRNLWWIEDTLTENSHKPSATVAEATVAGRPQQNGAGRREIGTGIEVATNAHGMGAPLLACDHRHSKPS